MIHKPAHFLAFILIVLCFTALVSFADEEPQTQTKPDKVDEKIEIPVYGVRIIPEFCTKELDIDGENDKIEISYQVYVTPDDFRDLSLTFTCREITKNANKVIEYASLDLPENSEVYTFEFQAPDYEAKLVFRLMLTPTKIQDPETAYSQEFTCNVFSSKVTVPQTQPAVDETLSVHLAKPEYNIEKTRDELIDVTFYKLSMKLNLTIKNAKLPIIWTRKVEYTCNKNLPEYLKNVLPPTATELEQQIAHIDALPPKQTQELQQSFQLTYVKDLFPLSYKQIETIAIGDQKLNIEIKFKIFEEKKFPPKISVRLISGGKNLQMYELQ